MRRPCTAVPPKVSAMGLCRLALLRIEGPRAEYDQATDRFLGWTSRIRAGLEDAIRLMEKG